jgi:hypothetical protein
VSSGLLGDSSGEAGCGEGGVQQWGTDVERPVEADHEESMSSE